MERVRRVFGVLGLIGFLLCSSDVSADYVPPAERINQIEPFLVDATAYSNPYNNLTSDGSRTIEGLTAAGAIEWRGCTLLVYECKDDGTIGPFIGYYILSDVGYGQDSGIGKSKLLKNKSKGTIELGKCIDIYMEDEEDCVQFGRQKVYIQVLKGEG